jgi:putative molybdopterin biosynthesis protein
VKQEQFLQVVSRDEAERRFRAAVEFGPLGSETCDLERAWDRVLAEDVRAPIDVPGFARANVDGYALRAADTFDATEEGPSRLALNGETITTGLRPRIEVGRGTATVIATGAALPRGADAVVMVEDTDAEKEAVLVKRAVAPGAHVSQAGSDIARGETVLHAGDHLTSRETGVLAALGIDAIEVVRRPRVALFSTGNEIVAPGRELPFGGIYDSNGRILADAIKEAGGEPLALGIVGDDEAALRATLERALQEGDLVLLSGGTSKGVGDICHRIVAERGSVLVHGVALKPGKPILIAVIDEKPVVLLPGFPTSAIFTFHEFVAPWIRGRAGLPPLARGTVRARLPRAVVSERGRTEYDLVHLVGGPGGTVAYPLGKGSGSVTTFSRADGFHAIPAQVERRESDEEVEVTLLGPRRIPDLVVMGSHCTGLDLLLARLRALGITSRMVSVGSTAGLEAARRGECDIAGIHLFDPQTERYNEPFLEKGLRLLRGYGRRQGVVSRDGSETGRMVNRNRGSGTRILIDRMLEDRRPDGYEMEVRSHRAVAAAVAGHRADWGVCIENVAQGLSFRFLAEERFDFVVPTDRLDRPPVKAFGDLLAEPGIRASLAKEGFCP